MDPIWSFEAFMLTYAVVGVVSYAMIFSDDDFTRFYTHTGAKRSSTTATVAHTWTVLGYTVLGGNHGVIAPQIFNWWHAGTPSILGVRTC